MVQAYSQEHPRSLNLDQEVQRPSFQVDSDFGGGEWWNKVAPFRSRDKLVQRDLIACFGAWTNHKHMEVALIFLSFPIAAPYH